MLPGSAAVKLLTLSDYVKTNSSGSQALPDVVGEEPNNFSFNNLPSLLKLKEFSLDNFTSIESNQVQMLIIDDLDEVHPEFSKSVLSAVEEELNKEWPNSVLFIVIGRPEAFQSVLSDPKLPAQRRRKVFDLRLPNLSTTGDIAALYKNYIDYKGEVAEEKFQENSIRVVQGNLFLKDSINRLALMNMFFDILRSDPNPSAESLQDALVEAMLNRNSLTHGRPAKNFPEYVTVLENIAAKYATNVVESGRFLVRSHDTVDSPHGPISVHKVLNYSGLCSMVPASSLANYYQFEPLWVHSYLVQQWNKRNVRGYKFENCRDL